MAGVIGRLAVTASGSAIDRFTQSFRAQNSSCTPLTKIVGVLPTPYISPSSMSFLTSAAYTPRSNAASKRARSNPSSLAYFFKRRNIESFLVLEKQRCVLKEFSLSISSVRGFRCFARVFMLVQWEIADHEPHFIAVRFQYLFQNGMHRCTCRTLEISELNDRYRRIGIAARWIVVNTDVLDRLGRLRYQPTNVCALAESR